MRQEHSRWTEPPCHQGGWWQQRSSRKCRCWQTDQRRPWCHTAQRVGDLHVTVNMFRGQRQTTYRQQPRDLGKTFVSREQRPIGSSFLLVSQPTKFSSNISGIPCHYHPVKTKADCFPLSITDWLITYSHLCFSYWVGSRVVLQSFRLYFTVSHL